MKRGWFWIIAVIVLAAAAYAAKTYWKSTATSSEEAPEIVAVERGDIRVTVASTGVVQSNLDVEIKCKASGEIVSLPYDISDSVDEGTLLVELDPVDEQRNVRQAEVNLASSKAKLEQSRQTLATAELDVKNSRREADASIHSAEAQAKDRREKAERTKALLEKKYASPEECETAETEAVAAAASLELARVKLQQVEVEEKDLEIKRQDIILAECNVESDSIALETAKQRLIYTKVYAPMAGVISQRYVQKGQIISSPTSNVGGGTALLMLSDLSQVFVLAAVDESDIGQIKVGQPVDITVDAFPDKHFPGKVVRIATTGENVSNVVTFEVKIEVLSEEKSHLRPEMTANVEILAAEQNTALVLPTECLLRKGQEQYVLLPAAPGQQSEHRTVTTGLDNGIQVEILSGLNEGDQVLASSSGSGSRWSRSEDSEKQSRNRGPMMLPMGGPPRR